jgi:hypothetical protein
VITKKIVDLCPWVIIYDNQVSILKLTSKKLSIMQQKRNLNRVMETETIQKNVASPKSLMSRGNKQMAQLTLLLGLIFVLNSCAAQKEPVRPATKTISINSEPAGAKVIANGQIICNSTPCTATIPLTYKTYTGGGFITFTSEATHFKKSAEMNQIKFTFIKDGYVQGEEIYEPDIQAGYARLKFTYPDGVFHILNKQTYAEDPTIRTGEATKMVTRDQPGATALERTIIRWHFDSEPRGGRIFWRVISSIPDQVKNTNELYLTSTPYEETRSFNILGLTYENSRDVVIEIKVTKAGYMDQVKRYNVRQAIDQQEISGFFELVKQ